MSVYSIKDLEHLSGIKAHTIRIWEQRYDLFSPQRTSTNIRFYDEEDLKLILNIALLKNHGYKISRIVSLSQLEMEEEVRKIEITDQTYEDRVSALSVAMIDMDEDRFTNLLNKFVAQEGFENAMMNVIYPFMRKIGILWLTNTINPAQEHFITHLVRQKLIVATESLSIDENAKLFLLFLPEGELHELGLLFANFLIRSRGHKTIFFGQTVPLKALEEVYHKLQPDYLITAMTTTPEPSKVQTYVDSLAKKFKPTTVFITGGRVIGQGITCPDNIEAINKFEDLMEFVDQLSVIN